MANKQETNWIARIISAIIFAIAVYLIFRPICYLFKSWKIQKGNKTIIQNLHHNLGDFWLTEQEKQQFLFHTAQCDLADKKIKEFINQNIERLFEIFTNDQLDMIKYCNSLSEKL